MNFRQKIAFFSLAIIHLGISEVYAQQPQDPELSKTYMDLAEQIYEEARDAIEIAKENFILAAEADTTNLRANYMAGRLYLETVNRENSIKFLMRVYRQNPKYIFNILYLIGRGYQYGLEFEMALDYFSRYLKHVQNNSSYRGANMTPMYEVKTRIEECKNGLEIINIPAQYAIENVGPAINSPWPDYAPVLNEDETLMIFTSRRQEGNVNENVDRDNFYYEDIYFSRKVNGKWEPSKNIGEPINTSYHDSNLFLSSDGRTLYIYSDQNNGDIFYSTQSDDGEWSKPIPLEGRVNSKGFSEKSVFINKEGNLMFFTSNRPGGMGGFDIFGVHLSEKGTWDKPFNLGTEINTREDEDGPFLASDGKTLYFSSTGHKGFGGYDIFKSVYDSSRQEWGKPENLGYPVNTVDDEVYFYPTADGRRGYLASVREEGLGFTDIYMVRYLGTDQESLKDILDRKAAIKEAELADVRYRQKMDSLIAIPAYNIFFDFDSKELKDQNKRVLNKMYQAVKDMPGLGIRVVAYASPEGNPRYNFELSNKRAQEVRNFLIELGLQENRAFGRGYGVIKEGEKVEGRRAEIKVVDLDKVYDDLDE